MMIDRILEKCKHLTISERRVSSPDYEEWIVYAKDMEHWNAIFTDIFGPAIKKAGAKTTQENFALTVDHGGIFDEQTLFHCMHEDKSIIAMFWPWKDREHVTIKVAG